MHRLRLLLALVGSLVLLGLTPVAADAAGPAPITGRVSDSGGKPLAGVTVVAEPGRPGPSTTTGADGTYSLRVDGELQGDRLLCAGGYFGSTAADHRLNDACEEDVEPGQRVDLTLSRRGQARGVVTDQAGRPVAGASVVVCSPGSGALGDTSPIEPDQTTTTAADGSYAVLAAGGPIGIAVSKTGYATTRYADAPCFGPEPNQTPSTIMPVDRDLTGLDVVLPTSGGTVAGVDRPYVAGTPHVGWTVTARPGTWSPADVSIAYQWYLDGTAIDGATKNTLVVPTAPGRTLSVRVTASAPGRGSASRDVTVGAITTAPRTTVASVHRPYAVGTPKVDWLLGARPGTWSPATVTVTYRWTIDGRTVGTGPAFRPTGAQRGRTLSLTATASAKGYRSASRTVTVGTVA